MPRYNKDGEEITSIKGLIEGDMRGLPSDKLRKSLSSKRGTIELLSYPQHHTLDPQTPAGKADFYWRTYKTTCYECGFEREHGRGWLFVGMTPEGEMKTFCSVDCCDAWEKVGDNTNARKAAIMAQREKRG
jgi:hypothetical protein